MATKKETVPEEVADTSAHTRWYLGALIIAALLFVGATWLAASRQLAGWESTWLIFVNSWPDSLRTFFLVASIAPESLWFGTASVVVAFACRMYRLAWCLASSVVIGSVAVAVTKHVVARARPEQFIGDLHVRVSETNYGFPSGHTMMLTVIVLTLFPYVPRGWRWLLLVPVALIALSRLYLGVHAPLDLVGGFAIGVMAVAVLHVLPRSVRRWLRFS